MATSRDNIKFYLDVEATDLQRGNKEKVLSGSKIHKTAGRGSIPQLIQFYGQFSDDSKVLQTHTTLKVNVLASVRSPSGTLDRRLGLVPTARRWG